MCSYVRCLTLESPLDCKEIQPVHSKGDQSLLFIGRTDAKAETPILWPPDGKNWLIRKAPDAGKDWRQEEKGTTEGEMVGWHHRLDGHGFEWTLGVGWRGVLQSMGFQRVGHDWATEPSWWTISPWVEWVKGRRELPTLALQFFHKSEIIPPPKMVI